MFADNAAGWALAEKHQDIMIADMKRREQHRKEKQAERFNPLSNEEMEPAEPMIDEMTEHIHQ